MTEAEKARYRRAFQRMRELAHATQESTYLLYRNGKYLIRTDSTLYPGEIEECIAGANP